MVTWGGGRGRNGGYVRGEGDDLSLVPPRFGLSAAPAPLPQEIAARCPVLQRIYVTWQYCVMHKNVKIFLLNA